MAAIFFNIILLNQLNCKVLVLYLSDWRDIAVPLCCFKWIKVRAQILSTVHENWLGFVNPPLTAASSTCCPVFFVTEHNLRQLYLPPPDSGTAQPEV